METKAVGSRFGDMLVVVWVTDGLYLSLSSLDFCLSESLALSHTTFSLSPTTSLWLLNDIAVATRAWA